MNRVTDVIVRATVVLISAFAVWKSAQLARADLAWSDGSTAGLHRAVEILPHSEAPRQFWREWLERLSDGRVLFPATIDEAAGMITGTRR